MCLAVVLAPSTTRFLPIHLHCLIAIFTPSYYYIYNNFFSVIYWIEWCNLGITQIYARFFKKIYKLFLWIPDIREIYIKLFTNSSEIKKKSTQGGERGEIVAGCSVLAFMCQARHDCLLDAEAERTNAQGRIARTHAPAYSHAGGCIARPKKRSITTGKSTGWSLAFLQNKNVSSRISLKKRRFVFG